MQLIFRDDDTSYFTTPALLERVYAPVWEHHVPVCLAVIPAHLGNIVITEGERTFLDPNVPPADRGKDQTYPVTDNAELCAYLNDKIRQGLVEICLHGYTHDWREFGAADAGVIRQKLDDGLALLAHAFPSADIRTFLIPYDVVSHAALDIILDYGLHTSLSIHNIPPTSPLRTTTPTPNRLYLLKGNVKFYTLGDWDMIDYTRNLEKWLAQAEDPHATLVCLNHYYMFYQDFGAENTALFTAWQTVISRLLPKYARQVTTFSRATAQAQE